MDESRALDQDSWKRMVTVGLSQVAYEALVGKDGDNVELATTRMETAVRFYLRDKRAKRPAWPYPPFLRRSEVREDVKLELDVGSDVWGLFEAEAQEQDVSVQQLSEHAAFYFAAELDAGRITQRILDDLGSAAADA